jgi:hypothetical protein
MESKNDDPGGYSATVLGDCEPVCARCGRAMAGEVQRVIEGSGDRRRRRPVLVIPLGEWVENSVG